MAIHVCGMFNLILGYVYYRPRTYVRTTGGYVFTGVCLFGGGSQVQVQVGGVPGPGGGVPGPGGGVPGQGPGGGGGGTQSQ